MTGPENISLSAYRNKGGGCRTGPPSFEAEARAGETPHPNDTQPGQIGPGWVSLSAYRNKGGCTGPPAASFEAGRRRDRHRQSQHQTAGHGPPQPTAPGRNKSPRLIGKEGSRAQTRPSGTASHAARQGGAAPSTIPKRKRRARHPPHARRKRLRVGPGDSARGIAEPPPPSVGGGLSLRRCGASSHGQPQPTEGK